MSYKWVNGEIVPMTQEEIDALERYLQPVPVYVTKLQLVRALRANGLEAAFDAGLAAADAQTQKDFSLAQTLRRDDPLVVAFAISLGITSEQLDDIYRMAATL